MKKLALILLVALSIKVFPCESNFDCQVGSQCVKHNAFQPGVCAGGLFPGNSYDNQPVYNQYDSSDSIGDTCNFNAECGFGRRCIKKAGKLYGVCY